MKTFKLAVLFVFITVHGYKASAQVMTYKTNELEDNKVQIFTDEERNNLYNWFDRRFDKMDLPKDKQEEYYSIIVYYFVKMSRLDDKDKGRTKKEVERDMKKLLKKQDKEIRELLTDEEYKLHRKYYDRLIKTIKTRLDETDKY